MGKRAEQICDEHKKKRWKRVVAWIVLIICIGWIDNLLNVRYNPLSSILILGLLAGAVGYWLHREEKIFSRCLEKARVLDDEDTRKKWEEKGLATSKEDIKKYFNQK